MSELLALLIDGLVVLLAAALLLVAALALFALTATAWGWWRAARARGEEVAGMSGANAMSERELAEIESELSPEWLARRTHRDPELEETAQRLLGELLRVRAENEQLRKGD